MCSGIIHGQGSITGIIHGQIGQESVTSRLRCQATRDSMAIKPSKVIKLDKGPPP